MGTRILKVLMVVLLSSLFVVPALSSAQTKEPIKIGYLAPITGFGVAVGKDMVDGANLYLDEVGRQLAGRQVELLIEDTESTPAVALTKGRKLVEMKNVDILMGSALAASGLALQPYADSKGIPLVLPVVAADDLTQRKNAKWVVRTGWSSSQPSHPFGEYAYKVLGYRKIASVAMDYAFGWEVLGGLQRTFEESGGTIIQKIWAPLTTPDFSPYLAQIDRNADAVFTNFGGALGMKFLKQYQEYGLKGKIPLIGSGVVTDESILPALGDEALGVMSALHYSAAIDTPQNKEFVKKYRAKYGKLPSYFSETCYTAMRLIDQALTSLKGDTSSPQKLLKALKAVDLKESPRGPIKFDSYGNPVHNIYIRKVERVGGELQNTIVYTYSGVSQFWKYNPEEYLKLPLYTRDYPPLKK